MHGFRILERPRLPCRATSVVVAVDEDGAPLRFTCTEPAGRHREHLARDPDGAIVFRWSATPYPVA